MIKISFVSELLSFGGDDDDGEYDSEEQGCNPVGCINVG